MDINLEKFEQHLTKKDKKEPYNRPLSSNTNYHLRHLSSNEHYPAIMPRKQ